MRAQRDSYYLSFIIKENGNPFKTELVEKATALVYDKEQDQDKGD